MPDFIGCWRDVFAVWVVRQGFEHFADGVVIAFGRSQILSDELGFEIVTDGTGGAVNALALGVRLDFGKEFCAARREVAPKRVQSAGKGARRMDHATVALGEEYAGARGVGAQRSAAVVGVIEQYAGGRGTEVSGDACNLIGIDRDRLTVAAAFAGAALVRERRAAREAEAGAHR